MSFAISLVSEKSLYTNYAISTLDMPSNQELLFLFYLDSFVFFHGFLNQVNLTPFEDGYSFELYSDQTCYRSPIYFHLCFKTQSDNLS